jgi:glyoxylase-like metal-dependent hydrolase (beta-lactamase superfamily II)
VTLAFIGSLAALQPSTTGKAATQSPTIQARHVVEASVSAMGGIEALLALNDVTRQMTGTRSDAGQGLTPVSADILSPPVTNTYTALTSVRELRSQRLMEYRESQILGGQPIRFKTVLNANGGFTGNLANRTVRQFPPAALPSVRAANFRRYPESLLRAIWTRPQHARWIREGLVDGWRQDIIAYSDVDGTLLELYFDSTNHFLRKTEIFATDSFLGDGSVELLYSDWRNVGGVMFPFRYIDKVNGYVLSDQRVSTLVTNTQPPDVTFDLPKDLVAVGPGPGTVSAKELGKDVYGLTGPYNSMFVVMNDYVLVLEPGGSIRNTRECIDAIKKIAGQKPIRYVVATHFHFDHVAGAPSYMAEKAVFVTTPDAKSTIERSALAVRTLDPAASKLQKLAPTVETFRGRRVFDDGDHRVELYEFASPHAAQMIIAYLPREQILFEGDLLDLDIPETGTSVAGEDTADLAVKLKQWGLDVKTIVAVHGRIGTIEDLNRALAHRQDNPQK